MRQSTSASSPSYIDPSSLSLPSPLSEVSSPESSTPKPSQVASSSTSMATSAPPRKRARTDQSPEEKREARAHRNRIAAQNSRDRRKAQFVQLEERVRALAKENEQLRAELQRERERRDGVEKDRENAELKERVKSLEQGWETFMNALRSQGNASSVLANVTKTEERPAPTKPSPDDSQGSPSSPTPTFPVFINTGGEYRTANGIPAAGGSAQSTAISGLNIDLGLLSSTTTTSSTQTVAQASLTSNDGIENWIDDVFPTTVSAVNSSDALTTSPDVGYATLGISSEQETSPSDVSAYEFVPGSMGGQGDDMEMELDHLLDLLPSPTEDIQGLLVSMMDNEKVSQSKGEDWNWELTVAAV